MPIEAKSVNRYQIKTVPQLVKIAQKHFNQYIRNRDSNVTWFRCISCQQPKDISQLQAGHYLSAGQNARIRFNEDNVNGQCLRCNYHLHGNQAQYRINLVNKIGLERVQQLEEIGRIPSKWDRYSLIETIETYKLKNREFNK